jgi:hypothetical protein
MNFAFQVTGGVKDGTVEVSVSRGFVNWREPKINGKPISGIDPTTGQIVSSGPPIISGPLVFDKYKRCYVCLRVKVDDDGTMPEDPGEDYLSVVISGGTRRGHDFGREYWLHPLAVIAMDRGIATLCQNVYFNLLHWVGLNTGDVYAQSPPQGTARKYHHYFTSV